MKFSKLPRERKGAGAGEGLTSCWTDASRRRTRGWRKKRRRRRRRGRAAGFLRARRQALHSPMQSFLWLLKKRHVARANFTRHGSQWTPRLRPRRVWASRCWMNLTCYKKKNKYVNYYSNEILKNLFLRRPLLGCRRSRLGLILPFSSDLPALRLTTVILSLTW